MIRLPGTLTIAAVGRLRTLHWQAAQQDYAARLERYTQLSIIEVRDHVGGNLPDQVAISREGVALLEAVEGIPWMIALDAKGKQTTSEGFASYLHKQVSVYRDVAFLIGGPVGLSEEVLSRCSERLSFSPMTFPHELARVMLLEQLYRAMTILSGEQYHK
ncbi:MAG: 23S rRNA (pseudouridine(1915)-N(3))-methyltransferase RlmH [Anaerolineae bacterium]|nr:23S rRNA (pseudouridine(1915)-N(3))-methyltransferase RlmH [Anaerolineae bacterium]